jgi:4-amino-4-deoxy-L-arabinose transferase-like glycosyltransferase
MMGMVFCTGPGACITAMAGGNGIGNGKVSGKRRDLFQEAVRMSIVPKAAAQGNPASACCPFRRVLSVWGPWQLFWLALILRLAVIGIAHYYKLRPQLDHFDFGAEMGRVARALATGKGFADPFIDPSGPTAWIPPFFPMLLGGIFKVFGVYTKLSAWAILSFDSLLNALLIPMIWEIGERCFSLRTARWSAWIWALYPAAMQYAVKWVWEMTLTVFLLHLALLLALRVGSLGGRPGDGSTWKRWLGFGLLWGMIALTNPGVLLFLPVCGIWMLVRCGGNWLEQFPKAVCSGLVFLALLAPWMWRNEQVFHHFVPLRTNFGAELCLGNGPGATGFLMLYNHPTQSAQQFALYRQMGEIRYVQWRGDLAKATIRADKPRFLRLSLMRLYFYWFGVTNPGSRILNDFGRGLNFGFTSCAGLIGLFLALRRRLPAARLFAAAFLLLPITYYLVVVHARFRHPLEPLMTLLGVWLFQQADQRWGFTLPGLRRLWPARTVGGTAQD